ncbi:hypothetical protein [Lentzea sp. CA-135723]|uniref:hypothetical protein n=1 Tax=Lentzea sp. CA-135723 TaxID=3239950 RepID=UPI003D93DE76
MAPFVRPPQFEVFDHRVHAAFTEAGESMPERVRRALVRGDKDWEFYTAQLFMLDVSLKTRRALFAAFQHATGNGNDDMVLSDVQPQASEARLTNMTRSVLRIGRSTRQLASTYPIGTNTQVVLHKPVKLHEPVLETGDSELQATTVEEFLELLRMVQKRSGLSFSKLAERAGPGLPRSQAYALVKEDRTSLPLRVEQIRLFSTACGLPPHQVDRVVRLWAELRDGGGRSAVARQQEELLARLREFQPDPDLVCLDRADDEAIERLKAAMQVKKTPMTPAQYDVMLRRLLTTNAMADSNAGLFVAGAVLATVLGKEAVAWYRKRKQPCTCEAGHAVASVSTTPTTG